MKLQILIVLLIALFSSYGCAFKTQNNEIPALSSTQYAEDLAEQFMLAQVDLVRTECDQVVYRTTQEFKIFIQKITDSKSCEETQKLLITEVQTTKKLFSYKQLIEVFTVLRYEEEQLEAIQIFKDQLAYVTDVELIELLETIDFANTNYIKQLLKVISISYVEEIVKMSQETRSIVVERFAEISYIERASLVINKFKADCEDFIEKEESEQEYTEEDFQKDEDLFGDAEKENRTMFIIDVSGSMSDKFTKNGQTKTRLDYVKQELVQTLNKMQSTTFFNIGYFQTTVGRWQSNFVQATPANIQSAIKYVNGLSASGGTDMNRAFDTFLMTKNDQMETAYILCDGDVNISNIPAKVNQVNSGRNPAVKIHTISFANGVSDKLKEISHSSGGFYRTYE